MIRISRYWLVFIILAAVLAYASLVRATFAFGEDADGLGPVIFVEALRHWGPWLPVTWTYAAANWLLTVDPAAMAVQAVMGPTVSAMVVLGWLFFLANAVLGSAIAGWLRGRAAAAACLVIFLSAPLLSLGLQGAWLSYPITHNSTMACLLGALLADLAYLARPRPVLLLPGAVLTALGVTSDPWMQAAYVLPVWIALIPLLHARGAPLHRPARNLALATLAGLIAVKLKLFGLVWFLPGTKFSLGSAHTVPIQIENAIGTLSSFVGGWAGLLALAAALAAGIALARRRGGALVGDAEPVARFFFRFCVASGIIVLVSFIVSRFASEYGGGGRYIVNLFYLVPLGALARWRPRGPRGAAWLALPAAAYAAIGLASTPAPAPKPASAYYPEARKVIAVLEAHHLTAGYAQYFIAANANAITILSKRRIVVHPMVPDIVLGQFVPNMGQGTSFWYGPKAAANPPANGFIIFDPTEVGPPVDQCLVIAARQFGPPAEILKVDTLTIAVWNHSLLADMIAAHRAQVLEWRRMNQARNIADIRKVCRFLHIDPAWPIGLYRGWLGRHGGA